MNWGGNFLAQVDFAQALYARGETAGRLGVGFQVPQVGEDAPAMKLDAILQRGLKRGERWGSERTFGGEGLHSSVATAGGDKRCGSCSAIEGEIERALRPMQGFFLWEEWGLHKDKDAKIDAGGAEKISSGSKLLDRHALVQLFKHFGMRGLEAHSDFELPSEQAAKFQTAWADECGMTLNDNPIEGTDENGDGWVVSNGNRAWIEKTTAVVELND